MWTIKLPSRLLLVHESRSITSTVAMQIIVNNSQLRHYTKIKKKYSSRQIDPYIVLYKYHNSVSEHEETPVHIRGMHIETKGPPILFAALLIL